MMRLALGLVLVVTFAGHASAQSYVGASFIADVVRVSGSTAGGDFGNGEAFGGALRVGTSLGSQWGVELELARTGEIETTPDFQILSSLSFGFTSDPNTPPVTQIFPPPQIHSERQLSTVSTFLWWKQEFSDRFSLVYLGGVAFTRTEFDMSVRYEPFPIPRIPFPPGGVPLPLPGPRSFDTETVTYDADPALGLEGRIRMTDHLQLAPGIRLQTAAGGWTIRPGIGLQWTF